MNATMLLMARANAKAAKYTKYCVEWHMVFYVTVVTFLMTLLMNMLTSTVMDDRNIDEIHGNY